MEKFLTKREGDGLRLRINVFLRRTGLSVNDLARGTGLTWPGVHYVRNGKRQRPALATCEAIDTYIGDYLRSHPNAEREHVERTANGNTPAETTAAVRCAQPEHFVMTAAAQTVIRALDYCARRGINGAIFGDPGVGKSEAMRYWSSTTSHRHALVFCRAYTSYQKLLHGLGKAVGIEGLMSNAEWDDALHEELALHPRLLVIDEADMLGTRTLDWLRTLWDESGHKTSFMLLAKPAFYKRLQLAHARSQQDLRQVWRRLAFRKFISGISRDEMLASLAERGLDKAVELEAVAALHSACAGSFGDLDMLIEVIQQTLDENPRLGGRITPAVVEKAREVRFGAELARRLR